MGDDNLIVREVEPVQMNNDPFLSPNFEDVNKLISKHLFLEIGKEDRTILINFKMIQK